MLLRLMTLSEDVSDICNIASTGPSGLERGCKVFSELALTTISISPLADVVLPIMLTESLRPEFEVDNRAASSIPFVGALSVATGLACCRGFETSDTNSILVLRVLKPSRLKTESKSCPWIVGILTNDVGGAASNSMCVSSYMLLSVILLGP